MTDTPPEDGKSTTDEKPIKPRELRARSKLRAQLLRSIRLPDNRTTHPGPLAIGEQDQMEREKRKHALDLQKSELDGIDLLLRQRRKFAHRFFWLAGAWLGCTMVILLLAGMGQIPGTAISFSLSDDVLKWLMGTGTAHVLAPALLLAKYLFGSNGKS